MALWTYYQYQRMLDYCSGFDRTGLDCFTGGRLSQLWQAVFFEVSIWVVLGVATLIVLGAAIRNSQRTTAISPISPSKP